MTTAARPSRLRRPIAAAPTSVKTSTAATRTAAPGRVVPASASLIRVSHGRVIATATGIARVPNAMSSRLPSSITAAADPGRKPCFMSMPSFAYPPPAAVGVTAEPTSVASTTASRSRASSRRPRNRAQMPSRVAWKSQGESASSAAA